MSDDARESYVNKLKENIWTAIELSKMGYLHIMFMPLMDFNDYLKWKIKFDEQVAKLKEEQLEKVNKEARTNLKRLDSSMKMSNPRFK